MRRPAVSSTERGTTAANQQYARQCTMHLALRRQSRRCQSRPRPRRSHCRHPAAAVAEVAGCPRPRLWRCAYRASRCCMLLTDQRVPARALHLAEPVDMDNCGASADVWTTGCYRKQMRQCTPPGPMPAALHPQAAACCALQARTLPRHQPAAASTRRLLVPCCGVVHCTLHPAHCRRHSGRRML